MTIQRQYVLPNCSLILEGLSTDDLNVLSVLANAEFKIIGVEKSLEGGSEFFFGSDCCGECLLSTLAKRAGAS